MARIRTIKPEFWTDDLIGSLPRDARLLFIGSWNMADDEGLLRWSAPALKGAIFPFDDDISVVDVQAHMDTIVQAGIMFAYNGGRSQQKLAYIINFHRHQKINRPSPSKLPPPSTQDRAAREMYARRDGGKCHLCHGDIDATGKALEFGGWLDDFCLSLDHLTPTSKGGTDAPSNIRASHQTCNKGRCNRTVEEYQDLLRRGGTMAQRTSPDRFTKWLSESAMNDAGNNSLSNSPPEEERKGKEEEIGNGMESLAGGEFDSFFAVFPKQEQIDNARKAYARALESGSVTERELLDGAKRYAAHVAREKTQLSFILLAKTWLADGCWKDLYGQKPSEVYLPPLDPSWPPEQVVRWTKNLGEVQFRTYFGQAEYIDCEPVILRYRSTTLRGLALGHYPQVAKEVALEMAA